MIRSAIAATVIFGLFTSSSVFAAAARSDLRGSVTGWKFPNSPEEGRGPVGVSAFLPSAGNPGVSELVPYIHRSPDQEEAGSCLYMSLTGIAELYLARAYPKVPRIPNGDLDLSERWLMNIAGIEEAGNGVENWKTDSVYLFNNPKGGNSEMVLNRDYPFAKGWYQRNSEGEVVKSRKGVKGAEYDATYSWIDDRKLAARAPRVQLPRLSREVLFADPEDNQWNTGVMPAGIVEKIKEAVRAKKPVHVIYNHFGYWHANFIVGYDDSFDNKSCKFVSDFIAYMKREEQGLRDKAAGSKDLKERERLLARAAKFADAHQGAEQSWARLGGCEKRGAFYVRDSIYGEVGGPVYDYDPSETSDDAPYAKPIVMLEYDWVRTMANHAVVITAE